MPGLSKAETAKLLDYIEPQGVKITPVKKGFLLRLPDGGSTTVHLSESDYRGPKNLRARLKRAGVEWPTDARKAHGAPVKVTRERITAVLEYLEYPEAVKPSEIRAAALAIGVELTPTVIRTGMAWAGYFSLGQTVAVTWHKHRPLVEVPPANVTPIRPEPVEAVAAPEPTPDATPEPVHDTGHVPDMAPPVREFIDTSDSWTANLDAIPDTLTLADVRAVVAALGLCLEVRAWRE